MTDYQSISALHQAARDKEARIEQTKAVINALETTGRALDAVTFLDPEFSLHQAERDIDEARPLSGVPFAHKELYRRKGWPDEGGSKSFEGAVAEENAHTIDKLDAAGAIDCGRLVSVEFALGVTGHNDYAGTPKNPWNKDYICGGSSSGSAAVVAAGIIPGALGTDTGGSIRLPAAACGLVGIKPSYGLVSRQGIFPLSDALDTAGPLTRSVEDAAMMLEAIAGYDQRDGASVQHQSSALRSGLKDGVQGMKVARVSRYFLDGVDTEVADATDAVFDDLAQLGANVKDADLVDMDLANSLNVLLIAHEAAALHHQHLNMHHHEMNQQTVMRVMTGLFTSADDGAKLKALRAKMAREVIHGLFAEHDILMTPVWPFLLPTINDSDVGANPEAAPLMQKIGHNTRPFNFLGLPAVVLPVGLDKNGLPLSVQLVGRPFSEARLLQAAYALEQHYAFWDKKPDLYLS